MNVSFYCKHCGGYLRKGNHSECKRILREQSEDAPAEKRRLSEGRTQQRRYEAEGSEFLSGLDDYCLPDEN